MKTKLGEIKCIFDFFKEVGKRDKYNYSESGAPAFDQEDMTWKCKICGEEFKIPSGRGMMMIDSNIAPLEKHIELHKLVKDLNI